MPARRGCHGSTRETRRRRRRERAAALLFGINLSGLIVAAACTGIALRSGAALHPLLAAGAFLCRQLGNSWGCDAVTTRSTRTLLNVMVRPEWYMSLAPPCPCRGSGSWLQAAGHRDDPCAVYHRGELGEIWCHSRWLMPRHCQRGEHCGRCSRWPRPILQRLQQWPKCSRSIRWYWWLCRRWPGPTLPSPARRW
ncbi:MAG: hypothetical protein FD153_53 [Rhodospirillaceae bacterium]|nr:MAG: hypothetical protein FD153_53 [Rhodospirillaceae bacterium]